MDATATPPEALAHLAADGRRHGLDEHLAEAAARAAQFASAFGASDWARVAGLWHDLGKYRPGFQAYIRQALDPDAHIEGRVAARDKTHSAAGALHALQMAAKAERGAAVHAARVLAYMIAGHHAGLADWTPQPSAGDIGAQPLATRLTTEASRIEYAEALAAAPPALLTHTLPPARSLAEVPGGVGAPGALALWVRLLFSCLVDADFLDTEAFMNAGKAMARGSFPDLHALRAAYDRHMARFTADTPVRALRADILRQCRAKAALAPGLFSLEVPTGGGKTLASLGFALDHACAHGHRRIVYAIPYTSIIEQTADVFREVFEQLGTEVVVEHHSQADSAPGDETAASRLACENWDAPLVVTTNVQLFESLFAARTSRCRKLHNLVGSVIILDEAQQLPVDFLQPILDAINLLVRHYGVTVVLCTATQPALSSRQYFDPRLARRGLDSATPLMADPDALYAQLKRVEVSLPPDLHSPASWPETAARVAAHDCVLAIVNTRTAARTLHAALPHGTLHLSALMCGAHRAEVIALVKARLAARRAGTDRAPLRVVSTQLVEAGVDLDFPVVFRALAGLDAIAQAAGRCNREGLLPEPGLVIVFVPPEPAPGGLLRRAADSCASVLHGTDGDPLDRTRIAAYFEQLYAGGSLDREGINALLTDDVTDRDSPFDIAFGTAAARFRLVDDDDQASVVVHYRGASGTDHTVDALLGQLAASGPERWLLRKLQRYIVRIAWRDAERLLRQGDLELAMPGLYAQRNDLLYDPARGLLCDGADISPGRLTL